MARPPRPHPLRWAAMLAAAVGFAALVVGCGHQPQDGVAPGGSAGDGTGSAADPSAQLDGRRFESTAITGRDLVAGSTVTIGFDDTRVSIDAGCNGMGGTARWDGDVLSVRDLGMTDMACEQPLMDQDAWMADWIVGGVRVAVLGDGITLTADDVVLTLTDRAVLHPDRPLVGTEWILDGILVNHSGGDAADGAVSSVPEGLEVVLRVQHDRLDVFDGLTWLGTPAGEPGEPITIGAGTVTVPEPLGGDAIGCEGGGDDCVVDVSVLGHDFTYTISEDRLTIYGTGPHASDGLAFRASDG